MPTDKNSEALSIAMGLFVGTLKEESFFPYPAFGADESETLNFVVDSVDKFMEGKEELFSKQDKEGSQSADYLDSLKELGLFGLIIPEEYGGIGLSNSGYSRVLQQLTKYDGSTSLTVGAHSSIGMKGLLLFGNAEQKAKYLPKLASGEMIAAFCLTEAGSGSDAASIKTTAKKADDGSWILNGEKIWITNGPIAEFFTVFARSDTEKGKLSAFIVEASYPGVETGPKEDKMGIRASATSTVSFRDVRVPAANLLDEEGKGFKVAMAILNNGRTGLGGGCVGAMKRVIKLGARQAIDRKQFGRSIAEFGLIQEKISQMTVDCFAAESVVGMVGHLIDSGHEDCSVEAAVSKVFATDALWRTANEALQIAAGNGFMKEYPYERIVRDSRINMIFEGTNEILRLYIALSGFKFAGDYLKGVSKGVTNFFNDPIKGFGILTNYASKKLSERTPIGRDSFKNVPKELRQSADVYVAYIPEFSSMVESLLKEHGKNIVGSQFLTKRIADATIDLFVGLCVLSRGASLIAKGQSKDNVVQIVNIFTQQAKRRINQNLRRVQINEDNDQIKLAKSIFELGDYPFDLL